MKRFWYSVAVLVLLLVTAGFQTSCPGRDPNKAARTAEEQFAINTDRVAEYTNKSLRTVEKLVDEKLIAPAAGRVMVDRLLNINAVNKRLILTGQSFVVDVQGVRVLRFTEDGRVELEKLADALSRAAKETINDPIWLTIDPRARSQLTALTDVVHIATLRLLSLIKAARKITVGNPAYIEVDYGSRNATLEFDRLRATALG